MHTDTFKVTIRRVRPGAWRDLKRDWERWSLGERIVLGVLAASTLLLLSLTRLS